MNVFILMNVFIWVEIGKNSPYNYFNDLIVYIKLQLGAAFKSMFYKIYFRLNAIPETLQSTECIASPYLFLPSMTDVYLISI